LQGHDWDEIDFLAELVRRTGCGLLLDVNNVHVSAHNLGFDATDYLHRFPAHAVTEVHLAGYSHDDQGALLIDSHDASIAEPVWALYQGLIERIGPRPTLIERDGKLPLRRAARRARPGPGNAGTNWRLVMNPSLRQFQDAFVDALQGRPAPQLAVLTEQPAFAVYRNTVLAGCVDALRANFPSVEQLVGPAWMGDAAAAYARQSPPSDTRLIHYGATFAAFLERRRRSTACLTWPMWRAWTACGTRPSASPAIPAWTSPNWPA
jgi:hypothetical protein